MKFRIVKMKYSKQYFIQKKDFLFWKTMRISGLRVIPRNATFSGISVRSLHGFDSLLEAEKFLDKLSVYNGCESVEVVIKNYETKH